MDGGGGVGEEHEALSHIPFPLHFSFHFGPYTTTHYQWQFKGEGLRVCTPPSHQTHEYFTTSLMPKICAMVELYISLQCKVFNLLCNNS